ncbi:MAG: hypothetical protein JNJ99_03200 [Crocinitomicaceae bacterium]|nr:hypothetical protein [Crocinitomicaceae bacterium]
MEIPDIYPTKDEVEKLLNSIFFSRQEIEERKRAAQQTGFNSWSDFLNFFIRCHTSLFHIPATAMEVSEMFHNDKFNGSVLIAVNNNWNLETEKEIDHYADRLMKLPVEIKESADNFDQKLSALTFKLTLHKAQKLEPDGLDFVSGLLRDVFKEIETTDPDFHEKSKMLISTLDDFEMKKTNQALVQNKNYYYLNSKAHLLDQLHDLLVKEGYIDPRPDFSNLFMYEYLGGNVPPILWKKKMDKLSFLLWSLNNKSEFIEGGTLDKMINRLFTFDPAKSSETIRASFKRSCAKFTNPKYVESYQKSTIKILESLGIK